LTSVLSFLWSVGLWVADITYVPTWAGFLYLAIVLDGLEPAGDRRPDVSLVSHRADLARRVTAEKPG
jgi:transposase InsO family protein